MQKLTTTFLTCLLFALTISIGQADTPGAAAAPAPGKTALIGPFGGGAHDDVKAYVPNSVVKDLKKFGVTGERSRQPLDELAKTGSVICADSGDSYIIGGNIDLLGNQPDQYWVQVSLTLNLFDCSNLTGKVRSVTVNAQHPDRQTAVDIAVDMALKKLIAH
jgi:hypothetical protein